MNFNLFNSLIDELNINTVDFTSDGSQYSINYLIGVKSNTEVCTHFVMLRVLVVLLEAMLRQVVMVVVVMVLI